MNIALFCTDIWYRVVHLLLAGAMVNILFFSLILLLFYWGFQDYR